VPRILLVVGVAGIVVSTSVTLAVPVPAVAAQSPRTPGLASVAARSATVTNLRNSGAGSFRAAIKRANAAPPGTSTIVRFVVRGTITLTSNLPAISRRVVIDATSAPGYISGGPPLVEVNFNKRLGLRFTAGSARSRLFGLAVDNADGDGVTLGANAITLDDNYIGLNLTGLAFGNRGSGVYISPHSARNRIGLNESGASGVVANVISGNGGSGITLAGSDGNVVVANRIGTNATGTAAIPNRLNGITITRRSDRNRIGGTEFVDTGTGQVNNPTGDKGKVSPVFVVPPLGNLISGNGRNGVLVEARSRRNVMNGNFIGTAASGDSPIGNRRNGVWIAGADGNLLIGCKFVNNPFVYYNVLSGNGQDGLRVTNSDDTVVQGNFFGIGANNTSVVGNRLDGIRVDGSSADTKVGGVIPLGNVSAGNGLNGIAVAGTARNFTTFNTFGGLLAFKGAAPNGRDGLLITSTGGHNLARTNVFSGNARNGIELAGDASGVTIDPNIAGLATNGSAALPNGHDGVLIDGHAHDNVIGGSRRSVIPQNTFSGNLGYGLAIMGTAHDNRVFLTFVGTRIGGLRAAGNRKGGILIGGRACLNSVGDVRTRPSNLISGNTGNGVTLRTRTCRNQVVNNYIGLDRFGRRLPNTGRPIVNRGHRNVIFGNRT
jgi:parallel beta-helix repeat protein